MAQYPKSISPKMCDITLGVNGYTDTVVDVIQQNFELNPNYEEVYITKDSSVEQDFLHDSNIKNDYGHRTYKSWVFDGTEEEQTVGYKYIQMYPYETPVLSEGDFVSYDYYHNGTKATFLCTALDSNNVYEQIGRIRNCTNEIRFINDDGVLIKIPCVFDNKINSEKNITLYNMKFINGITTIYTQSNPDSQQLHPNQRLLFGRPGQWVAFRIVSVGVNNFMNTVFWDNNSARVLEITMEASYVNEDTDDTVNGVADANTFNLYMPYSEMNLIVGDKLKLDYSLVKNDTVSCEKEVIWDSDNKFVVMVDNDGNIMATNKGKAIVSVKMKNNESVVAFLEIEVGENKEPEYSVVISPYDGNSFGILQGEVEDFSCFLYNNGTALEDKFVFDLETNANDMCYEFSVLDGNHFRIKNKKMSAYPIIVKCFNGEYEYNANIILKGAW